MKSSKPQALSKAEVEFEQMTKRALAAEYERDRLKKELATMTETHDETLGAMQDLMDFQGTERREVMSDLTFGTFGRPVIEKDRKSVV